MAIGSNESDIFGGDIEINTVHHGTKLVISRSKHGTVDTTQQHLCIHFHTYGIVTQHGRLRELVRILPHQAVFTVLILYRDFKGIRIDFKSQRLFGNFLQSVQKGFGCDGKTAVHITFIHFDCSDHRRFTVGNSCRQGSVLQFKEETIQNRQRILRINHTANSLQMTGERSTRNDKFHIFCIFKFFILLTS